MALPSFRSSLPLLALLIAALCAMLPPSLGATTSGTSRDDPLMLDRFHRWMTAHGRSYPSAAEKLRRFEVYRRNVEFIDASNRDAERLGYELGENEFTDLTHDEFLARYTGGAVPAGDGAVGGRRSVITTLAGDVREGVSSESAGEDPPQRWDWREHGAVTPAKQQGGCGCCWAFAAVATVESLNKIKGGELVDLSVQELVDCSMTLPFESPCSSGSPESALRWIKAKGGLLTEAEYPYMAKRGKCMSSDATGHRVGKITGIKVLPWRLDTETALALAVLKSPVSVQIDASSPELQSYKSGIFKGPCGTNTNHAVVVVGYGVDAAGVEYWIVKNSWGETWGQKGFAYIRKGADGNKGLCGIATWGVYPLMD